MAIKCEIGIPDNGGGLLFDLSFPCGSKKSHLLQEEKGGAGFGGRGGGS